MKLLTMLKTLPLAGVLALGLGMAPTAAMADKGERGQKERYSHDAGKSYKSGRHDDYRRKSKGHGKYAHQRDSRHEVGRAYGHSRYGYHGHRHAHSGHTHSNVIVRDYGHQHYLGLGDLRFMLGLHTDNVDIIFRD